VEDDTKRVAGRRKLQFANFEELLADVHDLARVETRQLGNWSLGQVCVHLAKGIDTAIDGAPFSPPWVMRLVGPLFKSRVLARGMTPGFRLPRRAEPLLPAETSTAAGIAALERGVERLCRESARLPHAFFGKLTREEWDALMLRHAELHLGFIVPEPASATS
jgi:hypothetical protein